MIWRSVSLGIDLRLDGLTNVVTNPIKACLMGAGAVYEASLDDR